MSQSWKVRPPVEFDDDTGLAIHNASEVAEVLGAELGPLYVMDLSAYKRARAAGCPTGGTWRHRDSSWFSTRRSPRDDTLCSSHTSADLIVVGHGGIRSDLECADVSALLRKACCLVVLVPLGETEHSRRIHEYSERGKEELCGV